LAVGRGKAAALKAHLVFEELVRLGHPLVLYRAASSPAVHFTSARSLPLVALRRSCLGCYRKCTDVRRNLHRQLRVECASWYVMVRHGTLWCAMVRYGAPWYVMVRHGTWWHNRRWQVLIRRTADIHHCMVVSCHGFEPNLM
jgi:hypothetical protein